MRNRSRWAVAVGGALVVLCAACTSKGGEDQKPGPSTDKERVLRVATAPDVSQGPVRQRLIEAWDKSREDIRVEIVKLPSAADDARAQLVAALQSGSADYDVVNIDVAWTAEFAAGKLIQPLKERLPKGMWPQVAKTAEYRGRTWAVPFNTDAALLYYRKDIWKNQSWQPPTTWDALDRAATDVRKPSQVTQTFPYGYVAQLGEYEGLTVNALEAVWAAGGELVDEDGRVKADSPETESGLDELAVRYRTFMPPEAGSADERDSLEMFRDEKVAFMRNWPYVYNVLSAKGSKVRDKFGVVALPAGPAGSGPSVLGGQNLAITARSHYAAEAQDLLDYLVQPEQQRCLLDAGFAPVLRVSYERDGPRCSLSDESGEGQEEAGPSSPQDPGKLPPYTGELKKAVAAARSRPVTPYYAAFTELVQTEVHDQLEDGGGRGAIATKLDKSLGGSRAAPR
jgi:multiple sugar transport system substrate-binding protein